MLEEVLDLSIGFIVVALPLLLLSLPGIVLFVVLPAILLLALIVPLAAIGAVIGGPPYLLARWLRRRRGGAALQCGRSASGGAPRVVDHEAPGAVGLAAQDVAFPGREPHRLAVGPGALNDQTPMTSARSSTSRTRVTSRSSVPFIEMKPFRASRTPGAPWARLPGCVANAASLS